MRVNALSLCRNSPKPTPSPAGHEDEVRAIFTDDLTDIGVLAACLWILQIPCWRQSNT